MNIIQGQTVRYDHCIVTYLLGRSVAFEVENMHILLLTLSLSIYIVLQFYCDVFLQNNKGSLVQPIFLKY